MVYVIITIYNAIFIKFQELQKIFSWTKILESGIYLLLVLSQTEQNKWFVWCLSIIIYIYIPQVLSDERLGAKLRVTENRCVPFDSFTYIYPALLPQHWALYAKVDSTLTFVYIYIYIYRPTKRCQVTGYVLQRLINIQETRINCFF